MYPEHCDDMTLIRLKEDTFINIRCSYGIGGPMDLIKDFAKRVDLEA